MFAQDKIMIVLDSCECSIRILPGGDSLLCGFAVYTLMRKYFGLLYHLTSPNNNAKRFILAR